MSNFEYLQKEELKEKLTAEQTRRALVNMLEDIKEQEINLKLHIMS